MARVAVALRRKIVWLAELVQGRENGGVELGHGFGGESDLAALESTSVGSLRRARIGVIQDSEFEIQNSQIIPHFES